MNRESRYADGTVIRDTAMTYVLLYDGWHKVEKNPWYVPASVEDEDDWFGQSMFLAKPATPPLVAAPPVPPVVPDSEALCLCEHRRTQHGGPNGDKECRTAGCGCLAFTADPWASGSGVVPDKPALAPETCAHCFSSRKFCGISDSLCCQRCSHAAVPAVTDDEAAAREVLVGAYLSEFPTNEAAADKALAVLRSAGFLIVHHTKET